MDEVAFYLDRIFLLLSNKFTFFVLGFSFFFVLDAFGLGLFVVL